MRRTGGDNKGRETTGTVGWDVCVETTEKYERCVVAVVGEGQKRGERRNRRPKLETKWVSQGWAGVRGGACAYGTSNQYRGREEITGGDVVVVVAFLDSVRHGGLNLEMVESIWSGKGGGFHGLDAVAGGGLAFVFAFLATADGLRNRNRLRRHVE